MDEIRFRQFNNGMIILSVDVGEGDYPVAMFDNLVSFSIFIDDCQKFRDKCSGEDIPEVFKKAFG